MGKTQIMQPIDTIGQLMSCALYVGFLLHTNFPFQLLTSTSRPRANAIPAKGKITLLKTLKASYRLLN